MYNIETDEDIVRLFNQYSEQTPEGQVKKQFLDHLNTEFNLIGFTDYEFGKNMAVFLERLFDEVKGDPLKMKQYMDLMYRIIDKNPLSPLLEEELVEVEYHDGVKVIKHPRYEWIEKNTDGTYSDVHGIAFINLDGLKWYGVNGEYISRIPITFPYYPKEKIVYTDI